MKLNAHYKLATYLFESSTSQNDVFGTNGLPLTPPSIKMIGNFQSFVASNNTSRKPCPYLTTYLDCIRSKNEKITVVFEHYDCDISSKSPLFGDIESLTKCGLYALHHLHYVIGSVHGLITPNAFLYAGQQSSFKLAHWAFNLITNCGQLCQSLIVPDDTRFLSIEQLLMCNPTRKSDVWSFGLTILYFMFPKSRDRFPSDPFELANCSNFQEIFTKLEINKDELSEKWIRFFSATLNSSPEKRFSVKQLMQILQLSEPTNYELNAPIDHLIRSTSASQTKIADEEHFEITRYLNIHDFYYLWCITFPTKDADKEKQKLPPILLIPRLVVLENECSNQENASSNCLESKFSKLSLSDFENHRVVKLPQNKFFKTLPVETINERLLKLSNHIYTPVVLFNDIFTREELIRKGNSQLLPLPIREMDFDYQCERLMTFKTLLNGYPFIRNQLISESKIDICPHYRAQIWAALLNVRWSDKLLYERIDKISSTSTDRQIAVDIPRCHQYNDLLASTEGHQKLTRVLKAWLAYNEASGEVYWQGLDSLAAPFVILNFNNEPQAFACFHLFIKKYLYGFFQKDNSPSIQEYLALFQIITSFHDPVMSNHFAELGFVPDLYAISWFLTMFTHILPLYQIVQLWDTLILGNDSFPLFVGLAILHQLSDRILKFTFNDCILIFSDLPQIDIDRCVRNSVKFFRATPQSITKRGLWKLENLKMYPRLPRIDLDDLIRMIEKSIEIQEENAALNQANISNHFVFIDCRHKDDISMFGSIANSVKVEEYINNQDLQTQNTATAAKNQSSQTQHKHQFKHHLVIVVNSIETSMLLIENYSVPRVCYLELNKHVPKLLQTQF